MDIIEKLAKEAEGLVEALKNKRFRGLKDILTDIYHDDAHFIYELLQNAEDAQATKVMFALDPNELKFLHNGKRQFNEDNVISINSIGDSTKKDDVNQIGKFGIGFKAVFSYTKTPQIYSGQYAFEIHDLVSPKKIKQILESNNTATVFRFPFNHLQKSKENAFQEIKKALLELPDNTIIFLRNIEEISWKIERDEKQNGYIRISQLQKENHFEIERKTDQTQKTYWLRFTAPIPDKERLFVAVAFRLEETKETEKFKIDDKVTKGDVSIFFPAEKENSGLKFYINAPFAATVARDSIQNKPENEVLRDLLVELLIESVFKVKEFGMLDRNFLEVLPNNKDELSKFYSSFREKIIEPES